VLLKQSQACPDQRTTCLQFLPFDTLLADLRQGLGKQVFVNPDPHDAAQARIVATAEACPVIREADTGLSHVALHHPSVQRDSEDPLFLERHAEDEIGFVKARKLVEQRAQIVRTAKHGRNIRRRDEERPQSRIGSPDGRRKRSRGRQRLDQRAQKFDGRLDRRRQALVAMRQQLETRVGQGDRLVHCPTNHLVRHAVWVELGRSVLEPVENTHGISLRHCDERILRHQHLLDAVKGATRKLRRAQSKVLISDPESRRRGATCRRVGEAKACLLPLLFS